MKTLKGGRLVPGRSSWRWLCCAGFVCGIIWVLSRSNGFAQDLIEAPIAVDDSAALDSPAAAIGDAKPSPVSEGPDGSMFRTVTQVQASDGSQTLVTNSNSHFDAGIFERIPGNQKLIQSAAVIERGVNFRIIQTVTEFDAPDGSVLLKTNQFQISGPGIDGEGLLAGVQSFDLPPTIVESDDGSTTIETVTQFVAPDGSLTSKQTTAVEYKTDDALAEALSRPIAVSKWGAHEKVVQKQILERRADGKWNRTSSTYTHLETGVAYQDENGEWQDSVPELEIVDGGVIGRRTQHKLTLASSPTQENPVDLTLPNGIHLPSRVLGLGYFDRKSGKSVVIAEIQDSQGQLGAGKDEVIYADAFKNFGADLRYIFSNAGLEQDVILNEQPPAPEDFGLDSASSQLEVITEFFPSVEPQITSRVVQSEADASKRSTMAEPDLIDDTVDFGPMQMGYGKAFGLWAENETGVTITKRWQKVDGRTILFEAVPLPGLKPLLQKLPPLQKERAGIKREASLKRTLPKISVAYKRNERHPIQLAKASYPKKGVLLDYVTASSTTSSYTFASGTTYRVVGTVTMTGGTTIQGGAIIKYASGAILRISNGLSTPASGTAYLLAETDNSMGDTIFLGAPIGTYAAQAISIYNVYNNTTSANLEIRNAATAIDVYSPTTQSAQTINNCRIVDSNTGVSAYSTASVTLQNVTICNVTTPTYNSGYSTFFGSPTVSCPTCTGDNYPGPIPTLTIGSSIAASIDCAGDNDFYKIVPAATTAVNIYTTGATDTYGYLLDSAGYQISSDDGSGSMWNFNIPYTLNANTTYYVRVRHASASGTGSYQIQAVPVSGWTPLVSRVANFGYLRTDFPGTVGFQFVVGSSALSVKELARWVVPGNSGSHAVSLLNSDGTAVPNGSVTINTFGKPAGFSFTSLATPVTLAAGGTYVLMSQETSGGDQWYDLSGTSIALSSAANNAWATWANPSSQYVVAYGGSGVTYVPVNLTYAPVPNTAPTLSSVSTLTGATEDTAFSISYATLAAAANEADADSIPIYFRVESISTGTLTKNGTAVTPGSTLLGPGETWVWTPAANANGSLNAFTIKAWDGSLASASAVQVQISVAAVNDPPTLTTVNVLSGATEDTAFSVSYATLAAAANAADVEGSAISFRLEAISSGTLTKNGIAVTPGSTLLGTGETWVWTPAANANGTLSAFTVKAWDGSLASASAVQVQISVAAVNDPPIITPIANQTVNQDTSTGPLGFTVTDVETPAGSLGLTGTSSNPSLVSVGNIVFAGSGGICTVTVMPSAGQSGSSTITITVSDGSAIANSPFVLTVLPKAQTPVLSSLFATDHSSDTVSGTSNGQVHYTINGVDPDSGSSTTPPTFNVPTTVKARAFQSGYPPSDVATLVVGQNVGVTFSPNGHDAISYSNGPLGVLMTADAGSTIAYKAGTTGSWLSTTSGSSPSIDGIDSGNGTIQAYAYKANTLASATATSLEYSFRLPQPNSTATYSAFTSGVLTLSDAVAGTTIRYTTDGVTAPTASSTAYSSPLTYSVPTKVLARAYKAGYIPSGHISAWVNRLPIPKVATAGGTLIGNTTVNNDLDVWLLPNFGFDNVYGENLDVSGWDPYGGITWNSDVPSANYPGSFGGPLGATALSLASVPVSYGRTYSLAGWYRKQVAGGPCDYAGIANYSDDGTFISADDMNDQGFGVTYLTQALVDGATSAQVANSGVFGSPPPDWYFDLFQPLLNFSRTDQIQKINQPNTLSTLFQYLNLAQGSVIKVTAVNGIQLSFSIPYHGPTLPIGTVVGRRDAGGYYQYQLFSCADLYLNWMYINTTTFNYLRSGTDSIRLLSLLYSGTTRMTGAEFWEGVLADRPMLYYTLNGNTAVYTQTGVSGPLKLTLHGNNEGTINLGQRGTYYVDASVLQRVITFKVATPLIAITVNGAGTQVTLTATTTTTGAAIYYTTDGTDPTTSSTLYNAASPPVLASTVTTKWKAFKSNYTTSDTVTELPPPGFNPLSGTYPSGQNVTITAPTGAQLKVFQPNSNVLSSSAWVLGSQGSQAGFSQNGATAENTIETRRTPYGTAENVWVARNLENTTGEPDDQDGGWNASVNVDKTKLYRFSVWMKKSGSSAVVGSGYSWLGCGWSQVSDLTGTSTDSVDANPYFWVGLLPLNDWYLVVGYVHPVGDLGTTSSSKVYNSAGQVVFSGTDFRWLPTTTWTYQRAYLYYSTVTGIQQEFWNPRVEVVSSVNDPIDVLFATPENSPKTITLAGDGIKSIQAMSYSAAGVSGVVTSQYTFGDSDGDGLPDWWEVQYFGNLTNQNRSGDPDGDGLLNLNEFLAGTNPNSGDTDGDGVPDPTEISRGLNPLVKQADLILSFPANK